MERLSDLALRRIPITQIWEEGLLDAPLPNYQLGQLHDRITLDAIYHEGLFNPDEDEGREEVDPDLFRIAVEQNTPNFIWPYLSKALGVEISYPTSPFDDASRDYAERIYAIEPEDYNDALDRAVRLFLNDIVEVVINTKGAPYLHNDIIVAWSPMDTPSGIIHKVLSIHLMEDNSYIIQYFTTFDDVVNFIFAEMTKYDSIGPIQGRNVDTTHLAPDTTTALTAIQSALQVDTGDLWNRLEEGTITIQGPVQLAVSQLIDGVTLTVVGRFLYLIGEDYTVYIRQYGGEVLLSSLALSSNSWDATTDPFFTSTGEVN